MKSYGENVTDEITVSKVLRSLSSNFDHVVAVIEESKDLLVCTFDELISSLLAHENRIGRPQEKCVKKAFPVKADSPVKEISGYGGRGRGRGDMYTEHQGYDVLEMINDDRHCEDKSDSDFEDVKKGDNLDDVKDIVDFQTEGEENVDIPKLSIDDLWLNKLAGKGRFVGEMKDPIPGLKGRFFVEQNDPDENFVKPKRDVSACKCAGKRGKKQVQINDSLDKDKEKVGEGSSHKDLGKRLAEGSSYKGKGKLGKDRSEPSKVSQTTKERWRKKKVEEEKNLKNAVDCPLGYGLVG
nr:ribosomal protein L7A/L8 [Tanacetum cinerariifolium]